MGNRDINNKNKKDNKNLENNLKGGITMGNHDNNKKESRIISGALNIVSLTKPEFKSLSKNQAFKQYDVMAKTARLAEELFEGATQQLNDAERDLEESQKNNCILKTEKNEIIKKYNSALKDLKESESLRESVSKELNKLTEELNNSENENSELKNDINDLRKDLKDLENNQYNLKNQLKNEQKENAELGAKIQKLKIENNKLEVENNKQAHRINGLVAQDRFNDQEISDLNSKLDSKDKVIEKLQKNNSGLQEKTNRQQKNVRKLEKENKKIQDELDVVNKETQILGEKLEEEHERNENLEIQLNEARGSIDAGLQILEDMNKDVEGLRETIKESGQYVDVADGEISGNNALIDALNVTKEGLIEEKKNTAKDIASGIDVEKNKSRLRSINNGISAINEQIHGFNKIALKAIETREDKTKTINAAESKIGKIESFKKLGGELGYFES